MRERGQCPECPAKVALRKDGKIRVHRRDTTVYVAGRPIYQSEPCVGSGQEPR